jgi:Protein of unknown function (DUF3095)
MSRMTTSTDFYEKITPFTDFTRVLDPLNYHPLPADWLAGVADVVDSTGAIAAGRYKTVNMVGAAVIAAVLNATGGRQFPFVFGGDGAGFAVPRDAEPAVRDALSRTVTWASEEMGLRLRAALISVAEIRASGFDLTVARYAPSAAVSYAMFSGGGMAWAEHQMKLGNFSIPPAPPGLHPDLTGLSCRYAPIRSEQGVVLSVIVLPVGEPDERFANLAATLLARLSKSDNEGRPVPAGGPTPALDPLSFDLEARAIRGKLSLAAALAKTWMRAHFSWLVLRFGIRVMGFVPQHYLRQTVLNTDFRKFDDGLKLTVDCSLEIADQIERDLAAAHALGICVYGIHRQNQALMTCLVPSAMRDDHVHFVDGAAGGYASAAIKLKEQIEAAGNR